jgi:hypothetical protein
MTPVMFEIEYKRYPDFIVSIRRLGFGVVTFIDERLVVSSSVEAREL